MYYASNEICLFWEISHDHGSLLPLVLLFEEIDHWVNPYSNLKDYWNIHMKQVYPNFVAYWNNENSVLKNGKKRVNPYSNLISSIRFVALLKNGKKRVNPYSNLISLMRFVALRNGKKRVNPPYSN